MSGGLELRGATDNVGSQLRQVLVTSKDSATGRSTQVAAAIEALAGDESVTSVERHVRQHASVPVIRSPRR